VLAPQWADVGVSWRVPCKLAGTTEQETAMGDVMDRLKQPETPQPVMGNEPADSEEVLVFDRGTGDLPFEPQGRHRSPLAHSCPQGRAWLYGP
jgi:hypothetical protein